VEKGEPLFPRLAIATDRPTVWTDAHCHITDDHVGPANEAGVGRLVTVGTDLESSQARHRGGVAARGGVGHRRRAPP
jgi:hypothetical protein